MCNDIKGNDKYYIQLRNYGPALTTLPAAAGGEINHRFVALSDRNLLAGAWPSPARELAPGSPDVESLKNAPKCGKSGENG